MQPTIPEGSLVLARKDTEVANCDVAIVLIYGDEALFKRVTFTICTGL